MKFKKNILLFLSILLCMALNGQPNVVQYVNPFIGTTNDANTYPGASVPFGMVSFNPYNVQDGVNSYNATSYHFGEKYIYGFSHTRLSGVGCPDMSSILLMPSQKKISFEKDSIKSTYNGEEATAGYYSVNLSKHQIKVSATATLRSSISEYTFTNAGKSFIQIDAGSGLSKAKGSYLHKISSTQIEGYKTDGNFCGKALTHKAFFFIEIDKKCSVQLWNNNTSITTDTLTGDAIGASFSFYVGKQELVYVRVGLSYVSMENARLNLKTEQPAWNFNVLKNKAKNNWNRKLSKIQVEGKVNTDKQIFYTGIYHILQHPNIINDVNGDYLAMGSHKKARSKRDHYSVFSLWDTYRNVHPFLTLVYPERQADMVASMIDMYEENSWLPKWELVGNETMVMVGDPALPVIADTYLKGIKNFDVMTAYKAMLKNANVHLDGNPMRPALKQYLQYGFIPNNDKDDVWGSVSTTLEYCFADWSLAQMSKALGKKDDYKNFIARSLFYKNLYDSTSHFFRPKLKNNEWLQPFDPITTNGELSWNPSGGKGFVEGNAWQYNFFVPHDINTLIKIMGGKSSFTNRLQKMFDSSYFVLWNEPDMAYPYLFNYVKKEEWRAQKAVSQNIKKYFNITPGGIPGNDDCGAMSAWLVFGMMGFYPDCTASLNYAITTPSFDKITIRLNPAYYKGRSFTIKKNGDGSMIDNIQLNSKPYNSYFLKHKNIFKGDLLEINTK